MISTSLHDLHTFVYNPPHPNIMCSDFNSHSPTWASKSICYYRQRNWNIPSKKPQHYYSQHPRHSHLLERLQWIILLHWPLPLLLLPRSIKALKTLTKDSQDTNLILLKKKKTRAQARCLLHLSKKHSWEEFVASINCSVSHSTMWSNIRKLSILPESILYLPLWY